MFEVFSLKLSGMRRPINSAKVGVLKSLQPTSLLKNKD